MEEVGQECPDRFSLAFDGGPFAKVGGQCVEVVLETIRTKRGYTTNSKPGLKLMDNPISHCLDTRTDFDDWDELGFGIAGSPDPDIVLSIPDASPKFIELNVFELELLDEMIVELATMLTGTCEPGADGGLAHLESLFDGGDIYPQSQEVERMADFLRWSFQTVHDGVFAAGEAIGAGVALQILDEFCFPTFSIPNHGMNVLIGNPKIVAAFVGADITLGCDRFLSSTFSLDLAPWYRHLVGSCLIWMICLAARAILLRFRFIDQRFRAWFVIRFLTQHFELFFFLRGSGAMQRVGWRR